MSRDALPQGASCLSTEDREVERAAGNTEVDARQQRQVPRQERADVVGIDRPHRIPGDGLCASASALSNTVSWLAVARTPSASQVSSTRTPGSSRRMNVCTMRGLFGSESSRAWRPIWSHTGDSDVNTLRPVIRYEPSGCGNGAHLCIIQSDVVTAFAVPGREHLSRGDVAEQPFHVGNAARGRIGGRSGPVQMHVDRQRGRRRPVGEMTLFTGEFGERQSGTTEPFRQRRLQVAGRDEFGEILCKEGILGVVAGCSGMKPAVVGVTEEAAAETVGQRTGPADDDWFLARCVRAGVRGGRRSFGNGHDIDDNDNDMKNADARPAYQTFRSPRLLLHAQAAGADRPDCDRRTDHLHH